MIAESGILAALTLGLVLGLKHATDGDHIVAVSTIASEARDMWRGFWIGASWGLGHTVPLITVGFAILVFKGFILAKYQSITPILELGVGVMLVFLGFRVFWNILTGKIHVHHHTHDSEPHVHPHSAQNYSPPNKPDTPNRFFPIVSPLGSPQFRGKSFAIGLVHGLAGTASIMLLILPTVSSIWLGIGYLLAFGLGTVLSMSAITLLLALPFSLNYNVPNLNVTVSGIAGFASIALGSLLMSDITLGTSFVPSWVYPF